MCNALAGPLSLICFLMPTIGDCHASGVIKRMSIAGGGVIAGKSAYTRVPLATSANTRLTVSSVRVELTCSFLVARIAVVARRKRFSIFNPASNTSSDRMIASFHSMERFRVGAGLAVAPMGVNAIS